MNTKKPYNSLFWHFTQQNIKDKQYIKDIDFIAENLDIDYLSIAPLDGITLKNPDQCYKVLKEMAAYALSKGIKIGLRLEFYKGYYNASVFGGDSLPPCDQTQLFPIPNPDKAEALVHDYEVVLDENGYGEINHKSKWARIKLMPLYNKVLRVYAFDKTGDGFYKENSLTDVTDKYLITNCRTDSMTVEVNLGKEYAGKTVFFEISQYYNAIAVTDAWPEFKKQIDDYADIGLGGIMMDEYGYMVLNSVDIVKGKEEPFRGRTYSNGMKKYYEDKMGLDLDRLLFDMRYAPDNNESIKIKAINTYFETLRVFPLEIENKVAAYCKEKFGDDFYISCHNTFRNKLDGDDIWRTACNWWNLPREWGHTDENISYAVRMGVMLAANNPIMLDMYYSKVPENYYNHIVNGAHVNCRDYHHAYGDFYWGNSYTDPEFVTNIRKFDRQMKRLNDFQTLYPKFDTLVIFGAAAQFNWYPDYNARNVWDIDGKMQIQNKCDQMWDAGYRIALAPDYTIEDGRITFENGKICFGGYEFSHCLFLYPKYSKKETYAFINRAHKNGASIAVIGRCDIDFDGNPATIDAPVYEDFDLSILEKMGCTKSGMEGGGIYDDGSFNLVSHGIITGEQTSFDFTLSGIHYCGTHTGMLAYRKGEMAIATNGSRLFADGTEIKLNFE